jgi:hypothetical protein
MKKLLAVLLLATSSVALADPHHGWQRGYGGAYHHHGGYYHNNDWIAPAIIGGVVGYAIAQPRTVYVQPQVVYQTPYCTPWTETMDQYGNVTRTRTCTQ